MDKKETVDDILRRESVKDYETIKDIMCSNPRIKAYKKTPNKFVSIDANLLPELEKKINDNKTENIIVEEENIFAEALSEINQLNEQIYRMEKKLFDIAYRTKM